MGLRGPGAGRLKQAKEAVEGRKRRLALPWQSKGMSRAQRVVAFLEFLPITKGKLAGRQMKLLSEQKRFIRDIYGRPSRRRARIGVKSEPRGNGKTGLVAGLALCHLVGPEAEPRGEVYSGAIDRQQAAIIFAEMEAIIYAVPDFAARVNIQRFKKQIEVLEGDGEGSIYEALSADARRAHGLAPSLWIYDELAQAKDRELLDNLMTAMGKRKRSLGLVISTQAKDDEHPLSQLIDDGLTGADPSMVVHLLAAPEEADPFDVETLRACNPALGVFLDEDDLVSEMERARRSSAFEAAFRNLRLNQRVDASGEARIVAPHDWKACAKPVDIERLYGQPCFGALDLSGKHDLTTLQLVFPDESQPAGFDVLSYFWTPEGQLANRAPAEQQRFREWIRLKHLTAVPGPTIRYDYVARQIGHLANDFDIRVIGYDRWRIDDLTKEFDDAGIDHWIDKPDATSGSGLRLAPFGQGYKDMAPALEFFAEVAMTGRLRHGANPVLTAAVANAIVVHDPAGNQKLDKGRSNNRGPVRIDGAVALAMALGLAHRYEPAPEPKKLRAVEHGFRSM